VSVYRTAVAESRAKARALRNAFFIQNCSVEEIMAPEAGATSNESDMEKIRDEQAKCIELLSESVGVDPVNTAALALARKVVKLEAISREDAVVVITYLNKLKAEQRSKARAARPA
jgi:hypothetical protein